MKSPKRLMFPQKAILTVVALVSLAIFFKIGLTMFCSLSIVVRNVGVTPIHNIVLDVSGTKFLAPSLASGSEVVFHPELSQESGFTLSYEGKKGTVREAPNIYLTRLDVGVIEILIDDLGVRNLRNNSHDMFH